MFKGLLPHSNFIHRRSKHIDIKDRYKMLKLGCSLNVLEGSLLLSHKSDLSWIVVVHGRTCSLLTDEFSTTGPRAYSPSFGSS